MGTSGSPEPAGGWIQLFMDGSWPCWGCDGRLELSCKSVAAARISERAAQLRLLHTAQHEPTCSEEADGSVFFAGGFRASSAPASRKARHSRKFPSKYIAL